MNTLGCLGSALTSNQKKYEMCLKMTPVEIYDEILVSVDDVNTYPMFDN